MERLIQQCKFLLPLVAAIFLWHPSAAQELVTGTSNEEIFITSDFTGTELVVFGTVNNLDAPSGSHQKDLTLKDADVVVTVEGPKEPGVVRKKDRVLGIWINNASLTFETIPSSYLMMTSSVEDANSFEQALKTLNLGLDYTLFGASLNATSAKDRNEFREAVVRLKAEKDLYRQSDGIQYLSDNLFRAKIDIPALIPVGTHTVNVYLLVDNEVVSQTSQKVTITKIGFEQLMYNFSREYGYIYGVFCVFLAMFTGWLSSVIFRRD